MIALNKHLLFSDLHWNRSLIFVRAYARIVRAYSPQKLPLQAQFAFVLALESTRSHHRLQAVPDMSQHRQRPAYDTGTS
jgi:hypothetical protein